MPFSIPTDLTVFSVQGLEDLRRVAASELTALRASITDPEQVTDEQIARLTELRDFVTAADENITARRDRVASFAALDLPAQPTEPTPTEPAPDPTPEPTPTEPAPTGTDVVTASGPVIEGDVVARTENTTVVRVADVVAQSPTTSTSATRYGDFTMDANHSLVAAADLGSFATGSEMGSLVDFARAFQDRTRGYNGLRNKAKHSVASIRRDWSDEFALTDGMNDVQMHEAMTRAADESRLDGGSLTAAAGWCAPSETLYTTCFQVSTDGMLNIPEMVARRGGFRHNQGFDFAALFGNDFTLPIPGYNILTEAEVIADTAKTCLEIPCPAFVDDRLNVSALCLTGSLLQNRGYPEFVAEFTRGAIAAMGHLVNREVIADLVAGSTAVSLTGMVPEDTTAGSGLLAAIEIAATDMKYRLRLPINSTLEVVLPFWARAQIRADLSRRTGIAEMNVSDAMIQTWFADRGARVQYVYDWQDAFSGVATGPGATTPITAFPTTVQFLMYPAGTWILARQDVIRLDSVYDSVNLAQNLVTQLFIEDGWAAMRMCPLSRVYTANICPSGTTSAAEARDCAAV